MRIRRLFAGVIALLVPVAVMILAATGVIGPGTWSPSVGAAPPPGGHYWPGGGTCEFVRPHQPAGGSHDKHPTPPVPGDISVQIPPTVFIRFQGGLTVVTTNTGAPPSPQDAFWVLNGHTATRADASTRAEVLAACSSQPPK